MSLGLTVHKALDYFFCDRCPTEAVDALGIDGWISHLIDKICPVQFLFDLLPKEPYESTRRIYFPRSRMTGQKFAKIVRTDH